MTTGFGPFELPTCGLLQRGWDHSPPKACFFLFQESSSLSQDYKYTEAKQNGGGTEWVELFITLTRGMGEPAYGSLAVSRQRPGGASFGTSCTDGWILGAVLRQLSQHR